MSLDNRAADRQTHAYAMGLGGAERIEDLLCGFSVQSNAGILDPDHPVLTHSRAR